MKKNILLSLALSTLLTSYAFGYDTSKARQQKKSKEFCSIRLFAVDTVGEANDLLVTFSPAQLEKITLFSHKGKTIAYYGMVKSCNELKSDLDLFHKTNFQDAFLINYTPKKSVLVPLNRSLTSTDTTSTVESHKSIKQPTVQAVQALSTLSSQSNEPTLTAPKETQSIAPDSEPIQVRGTISAIFNSYSTDKTADSLSVEGNVDATKKFDWGLIGSNISYLYDLSDNRRRYIELNELYAKYQNETSTAQIGRSIRNWGVLEGFSMSDVFNTKNYLSDSLDMSNKYGAMNAEYSSINEDDQYSIIVKLEERKQPYPAQDNVYNFYHYDSSLETQEGIYRPSIYLKYSGSSVIKDIQTDYSIILQNGYDNKRDMIEFVGEVDQHAYIVNKVIGYGLVADEDFVYKFEAVYADVTNYSNISDYLHLGAGVEYLPALSFTGEELKILGEYYRYYYFDDMKHKDVDFSEMYDNDIFMGMQSTFGDAGTSEIKGGILYDLKNREQVWALTFGSRLKENYRLSMEWRVIVPGDDPQTAIGRMGQFNQVTFRGNYFF